MRKVLTALVAVLFIALAGAGPALGATFDWQGNGYPSDSCQPTTTGNMLWVWTGDSPTSLTINGHTYTGWAQQGKGAWHLTLDITSDNYPPTSASVEYTGDAGVLTLSGCNESSPSPSPSESASPTPTPEATPTPTPEVTPTPTPEVTPTPTPEESATPTPSTEVTPSPTPVATPEVTPSPTLPSTDTVDATTSGGNGGTMLLILSLLGVSLTGLALSTRRARR